MKNSVLRNDNATENKMHDANDALRYLAFDNCFQASIISTVSTGEIIVANTVACKLLGYTREKLLTKNRAAIFDINERSFKKMMKERSAGGHSAAFVTAFKKSGKRFPCEITSAVFTDEDGVKKSVTTIADMSRSIRKQKIIDTKKRKIVTGNILFAKSKQKKIDIIKEKEVADNILLAQAKSDARQAENIQWKKNIGIKLYDVMWDWNIVTGEIFVGDSLEEVFGYKIPNNKINFAAFRACLLVEEKPALERRLLETLASRKKSWNDSYSFKRFDGTVASTTCRASILRNSRGKAIRLIGAMLDVSRVEELEKKLEDQISKKSENDKIFHLAAKLSFDGIWDWNILTNEFFLGEGFEELFGYSFNNTDNVSFNWTDHLHPDDRAPVEKGLQDAIASNVSYWEQSYRFIRADGSVANVFGRANIIRQADGKACRMIGAVHDLSLQKELEEKLIHELQLKEIQITDASDEAKENERSDIGKELHDNVNQLLGASRLYIDMARTGGADSKMYLNRSSEYTLTAIDEIRKLTKRLTSDIVKNLGLCEAIEKVSRDTMEIHPVHIHFTAVQFIEAGLNEKLKLTLFRIVQEQINNILKHAGATRVSIRLSQDNKSILLTITDNGIGFDTTRKQKGIGISNIKNRVESFNGTAEFLSTAGKGCILKVDLPLMNAVQQIK